MRIYDNPYNLWENMPEIIRSMFKKRIVTKLAVSKFDKMDFYVVEAEFNSVYMVVIRKEYGELTTIYSTEEDFYKTLNYVMFFPLIREIPKGDYVIWNVSLN